MEYRLKTLEWNTLKGVIGEQLARSFIRNTLAPKLVDEEGWDSVVFSNNDYKLSFKRRKGKLFSFDSYREDFIVHGFYACRKLVARYADVIGLLQHNHCTPDGLLLKLKEMGKTKRLSESACPSITRFRVEESRKHGDRLEFPLVDGDLEVVEIKCGRGARLMSKQKETYNDLIAKDVPLRMIKVRIVSFDTNQFLVEERKYERFL